VRAVLEQAHDEHLGGRFDVVRYRSDLPMRHCPRSTTRPRDYVSARPRARARPCDHAPTRPRANRQLADAPKRLDAYTALRALASSNCSSFRTAGAATTPASR
jgi:hypothetical protein